MESEFGHACTGHKEGGDKGMVAAVVVVVVEYNWLEVGRGWKRKTGGGLARVSSRSVPGDLSRKGLPIKPKYCSAVNELSVLHPRRQSRHPGPDGELTGNRRSGVAPPRQSMLGPRAAGFLPVLQAASGTGTHTSNNTLRQTQQS